MSLRLKTVLRRFGHTADFIDGKVPVRGAEFDFIDVKPQIAAYRRMVRDLEFDVCELAPTTYCIAKAYGARFTALPVFLSRTYHHHGLLVRPDAGIRTPRDLEGKKVGVRAYSVTTGVWTRGILASEYGVDLDKVTWIVDDEEHVAQMKLPPNVVHVPEGKSLAGMMASGEIQAGFAANSGIGRQGPPKEGWETGQTPETTGYPDLFTDSIRLETEYYNRTGIYPFHAVVVVRDDVLKAHPWLAGALYSAMVESKNRWIPRLKSGEADTREDRKYRRHLPIVGDDPMPCGIAANIRSIEGLIDYAMMQKLIPRRPSVEELFLDPEG
jgi:4,5-dihydroxyphthalate decarboxylase